MLMLASLRFDRWTTSPELVDDFIGIRSWSGLDPIDTFAEIGRMLGLFVRRCLAGLRRTRNPLLLILVAVLGLVSFTVTACVAVDGFLGGYAFIGSVAPLMLLCFFPIGILGAALFVNALRTLSSRLR